MALENWEVQVLLLLAQDPASDESKEVFAQFEEKFSGDGRKLAKAILNGQARMSKAIKESAEVFLRRATSRNAERESRELAHS